MTDHLLEIRDLELRAGNKYLVKKISLQIKRQSVLGLVGESGSGKTLSALSVLGLLPKAVQASSGSILYFNNSGDPVELLNASEKKLNTIRGKRISMIFQEPMTSLNPSMKCGQQVMEALHSIKKISAKESKAKILELFRDVKLPDIQRIFNSWPHELSGGQRQRVMLAMALSTSPDLLIADEPTTALDVTVQKSILDLLVDLKNKFNLSILFITHDLMVLNQIADEIAVMYKGQIVESGKKNDLLNNPSTPYTLGLLSCKPVLDDKPNRLPTVADFMEGKSIEINSVKKEKPYLNHEIILSIKNLVVSYRQKKNPFIALKSVSFDVYKGETLGLVGESGCGKTTLGRSILQLIKAESGSVIYHGTALNELRNKNIRKIRRKIQIVFQDPYSSLNPKNTIGQLIAEPIRVHKLFKGKQQIEDKVKELLKQVGLNEDAINLYPHQFSGGQRQRIGIARALACQPEFIILDESVSALDVSVQAQILNLLNDLKDQYQLTYIFISHDLTVVKYMSDRVMVMSEGKIIESGSSEQIYLHPEHAYTQKLIESIPV